jgi:hypothetical protein
MKKFYILLSFCLVSLSLWANPIVVPEVHMNELQITSSDTWMMEVSFSYIQNYTMTHLYIWTSTDTIEVINHSNMITGSGIWFTNDDLAQPLTFDPAGGSFWLIAEFLPVIYYQVACLVSWGNAPNPDVLAPGPGQSICWFDRSSSYYDDAWGYYTLDNSPTIGYENDTVGVQGTLTGTVYDMYGQPVPNVEFLLDWPFTTDANGHFMTHMFSRINTFQYIDYWWNDHYAGSGMTPYTYALRPDSAIYGDVHLLNPVLVGIEPMAAVNKSPLTIFPNPVHNDITISYQTDIFVNYPDLRLQILDISGREVYSKSLKNSLGVEKLSPGLENGEYLAIMTGNGITLGSARFIVCR